MRVAYQYTSHVFPFRCARVKTLSFSPFVHVFSHYKKILILKLYLFLNSSLSLSLLSCSVATIISFYIVFHHHHHHQCFFAGFGDGFICAHREECEEKEYEEKECRSLSARCYYAFHSNKNTTTIRERKDDDDDDSPKKRNKNSSRRRRRRRKRTPPTTTHQTPHPADDEPVGNPRRDRADANETRQRRSRIRSSRSSHNVLYVSVCACVCEDHNM